MRARALLREVLASIWAARIPALLSFVVVAVTCFAAVATVGKTASHAAAVSARITATGGRLLSVIDTRGGGFINQRGLAEVGALSSVGVAAALGAPTDAWNGIIGAGGARVPLWPVLTGLNSAVSLVEGRWPEPGEALVSTEQQGTLGLAQAAGFLTTTKGNEYPVVGSYAPNDSFGDLAAGAIVMDAGATGRELRVVVTSIDAAAVTTSAVLAILAPGDPQAVQVSSPTDIAQTATDLNVQLAGFGRNLLMGILGIGAVFVSAVTLADVLLRRRDLGRRRALGATRTDLAILVAARSAVTALVGAGIGTSLGWALNARDGLATPLPFTIGVAVLGICLATAAAVPPAVYAATRDPVQVLRTP